MIHIIIKCLGTKNMNIKHHQKICKVVKEAIIKATPKEIAEMVELYENQKVGWFWKLEGKLRLDFMLVIDEEWAE